MTEHVHEFSVIWDEERGRLFAYCYVNDCKQELEDGEIERCLNATERLSAEDASWCAGVLMEATNKHGVGQKFNRNPYYLADVLQAYADILEE